MKHYRRLRRHGDLEGAAGAARGPTLPDVSTTVTLIPLDDLGRRILDRLEQSAPPAYRWNHPTGARSYWTNADGAPADGYEAELDRLAPDWREHLARTSD